MVIVPYSADCKSRLLEIFQLNTPEFFATEEKGDFEVFLLENKDTYFVIKSMEEIVGGGGYVIDHNTGKLVWNMIHPDFRGQSLGITLINHCLDQMQKDQRINKITVSTSQYAYKFYEKFGFQIVEHKKDFRSTGLDLYHMEKPL